ncbi:MAG: Rrf2 family transcriptional regulator [Oscillospiraceae bacterium]
MQLTMTTDYAIRSILYLASVRRTAHISRTYIISTMAALREAGIVASKAGVNGGYWLIKRPEDVSLLDIIVCIEGTIKLNRCQESDRFCSRDAVDTCPVRWFYEDIQRRTEEIFRNKTIANLLAESESGKRENPAQGEMSI